MSQMRPKQIKLNNQGDLIIGGKNGTGTILPIGQQENAVPLVKNIGTKSSPVYGHVFEQLTGSSVVFDDSIANIGASNLQDAITKLNKNLTGSIVYTGTVDASAGIFTPSLPNKIVKGTYYLVTNAGNSIQTNSGGSPNQNLLSGDAIIWNGSYWDTMAHIDTGVQGTSGQVDVSGTQDTGYTLNIDSSYIGQSSIGTVGTITTGTWQGSLIDLAHGGTGSNIANIADNTILYKEGSGVSSTGPIGNRWVFDIEYLTSYRGPFPHYLSTGWGSQSSSNQTIITYINGLTVNVNNAPSQGCYPTGFLLYNGSVSDSNVYDPFSSSTLLQCQVQSSLFPSCVVPITALAQAGTYYQGFKNYVLSGLFENGNESNYPIGQNGWVYYPGTQDQLKQDTWKVILNGVVQNGYVAAATYSTPGIMIDSLTVNQPTTFNGDTYWSGNPVSDGEEMVTISSQDYGDIAYIVVRKQAVTSGQSFVGYNSSTNNFEWHSADDIVNIAKHSILTTEEFPIVSGSGGNGQIGASSNVSLTLTQTPITNTLNVFLNGDRLDKNDYSISGNTITLNDTVNGYTVEATDVVSITYEYQAGN